MELAEFLDVNHATQVALNIGGIIVAQQQMAPFVIRLPDSRITATQDTHIRARVGIDAVNLLRSEWQEC